MSIASKDSFRSDPKLYLEHYVYEAAPPIGVILTCEIKDTPDRTNDKIKAEHT